MIKNKSKLDKKRRQEMKTSVCQSVNNKIKSMRGCKIVREHGCSTKRKDEQ